MRHQLSIAVAAAVGSLVGATAPAQAQVFPNVVDELAVPAFIVAGKADPLVPIAAQETSIEQVRKLDSATSDGKLGDGDSMVYASEKGTPVRTLVHAGGHVLPPDAPRLIVDFFREQQLPKK